MDYSTFLNGAAKEELDRLDRLAGNFRIEDSKVTIDGCDWQALKKRMPEWVINLLQRKTDLSIVEKMKNGTRTWITKSSNGKDVDLMSNKGNWAKISKSGKRRKSFFCNNFFKIVQKLIL